MVMTLALLVYAVAERRLRRNLAIQQETLPNQKLQLLAIALQMKTAALKQQTERPTLRWVFQMLDGVHRVHVNIPGQGKQVFVKGLDEVKTKALRFFGPAICQYYLIPIQQGCSM